MRKFRIVYCFLDKKGNIQKDKQGLDNYLIEDVEAYNGGDAIERLHKKEKFLIKPEIIDVSEVHSERVM